MTAEQKLDRIRSVLAGSGTNLNATNEVLDIIDELDEPRPFAEDMPADGLRAAYENYHALRHQMVVAIDKVKILNGRIAEAAAKVAQAGGEI